MVKFTVDAICFSQSLCKCAQSFSTGLTHLWSAQYLPLRTHPAPRHVLFSLQPHDQTRNCIHSVLLEACIVLFPDAELLVTCMTCSSAPSGCWRSPVRFSSRSSLCEEFGMWWGRTEEWRVSERHLPGWSDRTNWSLALQDRDSQTSSQNRGSKRLKCFHPCLSSCRLYAVFTSSVWEYKVEMCSQTNQQWNKTWSAFIFPLQRGLNAVYWMLNVSLQTECSCSTRCSILGE